jgi:membrane associated rhomboid family serine protease
MASGAVTALYAVLLSTAWASGALEARRRPPARSAAPVATAGSLLVIGIPSLVQLTVAHGLLESLRRDGPAIADGEAWRLVTSLVVQDGGLAGTVANLVLLGVVGTVAERWWGTRRWLVIALAAGIGAQFWGLAVQPVGAGNSVIVFGLASSLAGSALRRGTLAGRVLALMAVLASAGLVAARDIHGGAAVIGLVLGVLLTPPAQRVA